MTEQKGKTQVIGGPLSGFDCDVCGEHHGELPLNMGFSMPDFVNKLLPWDRESRVKMSPDWCIVDDKFFYLRGCVEVPVANSNHSFVWGVWCTLSVDDFDTTMELWNDPARVNEPEYIGTLANSVPSYEETRNLRIRIKTRSPGERPALLIDDASHQLCKDQENGISREKVIELAKFVLHGSGSNPYSYVCER